MKILRLRKMISNSADVVRARSYLPLGSALLGIYVPLTLRWRWGVSE